MRSSFERLLEYTNPDLEQERKSKNKKKSIVKFKDKDQKGLKIGEHRLGLDFDQRDCQSSKCNSNSPDLRYKVYRFHIQNL